MGRKIAWAILSLIIPVVLPVNWVIKSILLSIMSISVIYLTITQNKIRNLRTTYKASIILAIVFCLLAFDFYIARDQYLKDYPIVAKSTPHQPEQPKQLTAEEIAGEVAKKLPTHGAGLKDEVETKLIKGRPQTNLTKESEHNLKQGENRAPSAKKTPPTVSSAVKPQPHTFALCQVPSRSKAPYFVEIRDITKPSSISVVIPNTSTGVIVDKQGERYCLYYSFSPIVGHSYVARFKDSSSPPVEATDFLNTYQVSSASAPNSLDTSKTESQETRELKWEFAALGYLPVGWEEGWDMSKGMPVAVALRFVRPKLPALIIHNIGDSAARDIKWTVRLWNMDILDQKDPLPIPVQTFEKIQGGGKSDPVNLFNTPLVSSLLKPGDHLIGSVSIDCPSCARRRTYVVYIVWGEGGWFADLRHTKSHEEFVVPKDTSKDGLKKYLNDIESAIPIDARSPIRER
ncbi:MAG: hypothetical protein M1461_12980 [Nitrospirae bacterium]|nr:hypothetical protein [Nitrospirota bacterium]